MQKHRYQVVEGSHVEPTRTYKKGEVVESHSRLDKLFVGKFKDLGPAGETKSPKAEEKPPGGQGKGEKLPTKGAGAKPDGQPPKDKDDWKE